MRRPMLCLASVALAAGCFGAPETAPTPPDGTVVVEDRPSPTDACVCDVGTDLPTEPLDDVSEISDVSELSDASVDVGCPALVVTPTTLRLATGAVASFTVPTPTTGLVLFRALADAATLRGTLVTPGGNVVAGGQATRFDVEAVDGVCARSARAHVEVVGPMRVSPSSARVRPGATVQFTVSGTLGEAEWRPLNASTATVGTLTGTTFRAGSQPGLATWVVRDRGSTQEVTVTVQVADGVTLAPRVPTLLVPAGRRVPLTWVGGTDALNASVTVDGTGGSVVREGDALWFDARGAHAGVSTVSAQDLGTGDRATVRIVVGDELTSTPAGRGESSPSGTLAWGDVNGDGHADLVVGQPFLHGAAVYGGRVSVHLGDARGDVSATPAARFEGARANDFSGQALRVLDVNGDGVDDVLVGSPERDLHRANVGSVEVWTGAPEGFHSTPTQALLGASENERFGAAFQVADVIGSERPDLLIVSPGARGPAIVDAPCAAVGRIYLHEGSGDPARPFGPTPWQTLELFVPDATPSRCHVGETLFANSPPALFDADGDGVRDLVVGLPLALATDRSPYLGRVVIYRGLGRTLGFERRPSRVLEIAGTLGLAQFGAGVEVLRTPMGEALVVRAPRMHANPMTGVPDGDTRGALYVFHAAGLAGAASVASPLFLTTARARASFVGTGNDAAGASAAVGDLDGDGSDDYLVGGWIGGVPTPGKVWAFDNASFARALSAGGTLTPTWTQSGAGTEALGSAVAIESTSAAVRARAFAVTASLRETAAGPFAGAVELVASTARTAITARWSAHAPLSLPLFAGGDAHGTAVLAGPFAPNAAGVALVSSPLANAPIASVLRPRVGTLTQFAQTAATGTRVLSGDRDFAQLGTALTALDFNGDGRLDLALGDPNAASGGWDVVRRGAVATPADNRCFLRTAAGATVEASAAGRGVVRIFTQTADGRFVERVNVYPREPDAERGLRGGLGAFVTNARDVNRDGYEDLLVAHTNASGAEVVLGRPDDTMGRITVACGDELAAPWWPARTDGAGFSGLAGFGDLDGDGCAETGAGFVGGARAGVVVRFGFGPRCARGHTTPFDLQLAVDASRLVDNRVGDVTTRVDDDYDRGPATYTGSTLGAPGDVTGDGVPDLLLRASSWALGDGTDPAVEVLSGAWLAGLCPDRVCPTGRVGALFSDGAYRRVAIQDVRAPDHYVLQSPDGADTRFGLGITGADFDGDGVRDLVAGAGDRTLRGVAAGAVMVWRGGRDATFTGAPWLMAVGDTTAVTRFGSSVSVAPSTTPAGTWVVVGAPGASPSGPGTGAAFRWFVPR